MTVNLSKEPLFEGQTGLTPKIRDGQKIKYAVPGTYVPGTYGAVPPGYDLPPLAARERSCDRGHRRDLGLAHPGRGKSGHH